METKNHLMLAKIITENAEGSINSFQKNAFAAGCAEPDVNLLTYIKGHTYEGTINFVRYAFRRLSGRLRTPGDFFLLGQAIHYAGDYFTFPHCPNFKGSLKEHINYEHKLHSHIVKFSQSKPSLFHMEDSVDCIRLIEKAYRRYLSVEGNVCSDWQYIRTVCLSAGLCAIRRKAEKLSGKLSAVRKKEAPYVS